MEAARRLSERGHVVTLIERSDRLGGTLRFAAIAYAPNERLLDWLERGVAGAGINVRLGTDATEELLRELSVDAVVVASGARRELPPMPGANLRHVLGGDELRALVLGETLPGLDRKFGLATRLAAKAGAATGLTRNPAFIREATRRWLPLGKRIVIIGGDLVGLELAEFLAERGRTVTVIDESATFGRGLTIVRRWRVLDELRQLGVALLPGYRDIAITSSAVMATGSEGGRLEYPADHVIVAKGAVGDLSLAQRLERAGFETHAIGDCNGVAYIDGAMRSAAALAARL
jgi:NADPH-dependent 2,4-dienoyl-CoA reductase/sulfur reductase-like enzyme